MYRPQIFLAAPLLKFVTSAAGVQPSFDADARRRLEVLESALQGLGADVFLAHRHERFGETRPAANILAARDLDAMRRANLVVAWPSDSYGVHIELGWASALGTPIIVLRDHDNWTTPLLEGLPAISNCVFAQMPDGDEDMSAIVSEAWRLLADRLDKPSPFGIIAE